MSKIIGTYSACLYKQPSLDLLNAWAKINVIPNLIKKQSIHSTIIYSKTKVEDRFQKSFNEKELDILAWKFKPLKLDMFSSSSGSKDKNVLVMLLNAPELEEIHNNLVFNGASHDFDEYQPHITLSYDVPERFDWRSLKMPSIYLIPNKIYFEPLDIEWENK